MRRSYREDIERAGLPIGAPRRPRGARSIRAGELRRDFQRMAMGRISLPQEDGSEVLVRPHDVICRTTLLAAMAGNEHALSLYWRYAVGRPPRSASDEELDTLSADHSRERANKIVEIVKEIDAQCSGGDA